VDFARFIRCPWLNLELHRDFFLGTAVCERMGHGGAQDSVGCHR